MNRPIVFISFVLFFFIIFAGFISAVVIIDEGGGGGVLPPEGPVCDSPEPICDGSQRIEVQYKCASDECEGNILQRQRTCTQICAWSSVCECEESGWNCGTCECEPFVCDEWSDPQIIKTCEYWQKCKGAEDWQETSPSCECDGECLNPPEGHEILGSEDKTISTEDVVLPVKLNWEDVEHAQSYIITANGSIQGNFLDEGEETKQGYVAESEAIPQSCTFKSNSNNTWASSPCCNNDGTNCKPWEDVPEQSFSTNYAPELIYPYDPDWENEEQGLGIIGKSSSLELDWCDVSEAESYRLRFYLSDEECHPLLSIFEGNKQVCGTELIEKEYRDGDLKLLYSDFTDEGDKFFTKNTDYFWEVQACLEERGFNCKEFSQLWAFETTDFSLPSSLLVYPPNDPRGEESVGLPLILNWNDIGAIKSYLYFVSPGNITDKVTVSQSNALDYPQLNLNSTYSWKIKACWDYEGTQCEDKFSEEWYFKTTGAPPEINSPENGATNVVIPTILNWSDVPGAKSYVVKINELNAEKITTKSDLSLDFPEIQQETNYTWQVKSCARDNGKICGFYTSPQTFRTFKIPPPQNPSPTNNGIVSPEQKYISWEKVNGAKAYQYKINLISLAEGENDQSCVGSLNTEIINNKITLLNTDFVELLCLGSYQWQVRSCLDEECTTAGDWSAVWSFYLSKEGARDKGLVPCGRNVNNPDTPWNEKEPCQIKHLFLGIKIIIDFIFLRLIPIALVLLTLATAFIFYSSISAGSANPLARVKSLWRSTILGILIAAFAWTLVNILMKLIGYNIGILGNWYQLPL